jgi:hypothetical protein
MREAAATGSSSVTEMKERMHGAGGGRRAEQQRGGRGDPTRWGRRRPRWDPLAVGMRKAPRAPENAALPLFSCKTQNLLRLLLKPLPCAPDLHFADADAFTATAGDSLILVLFSPFNFTGWTALFFFEAQQKFSYPFFFASAAQ